MIRGNKPVNIKHFAIIDHCSEGFGVIEATETTKLIGFPYGYCEDNATPHIEKQDLDGNVLESFNCSDISWIKFDSAKRELESTASDGRKE